MKNVFKLIAKAVLSKEFAELNQRQKDLEDENSILRNNKTSLEDEVSRITKRLNDMHTTLLPHKVISAIISMLPDPNMVANGRFVPKMVKPKIVNCSACNFEIRFIEDNKSIGDSVRIGVTLEIKNEYGRMVVFIPAERSNYHNSVTQIETYTWSIYQSGLVGVTDDLFSIIFSSTQAWAECLNELFM
jgi:hypothetical protein